ncbi:MAG: hypothetical protein S4CHLAM7_03850 [Chlamydiae bacterium]|nr:hypothetical protein [Chlamydiota bacterium]
MLSIFSLFKSQTPPPAVQPKNEEEEKFKTNVKDSLSVYLSNSEHNPEKALSLVYEAVESLESTRSLKETKVRVLQSGNTKTTEFVQSTQTEVPRIVEKLKANEVEALAKLIVEAIHTAKTKESSKILTREKQYTAVSEVLTIADKDLTSKASQAFAQGAKTAEVFHETKLENEIASLTLNHKGEKDLIFWDAFKLGAQVALGGAAVISVLALAYIYYPVDVQPEPESNIVWSYLSAGYEQVSNYLPNNLLNNLTELAQSIPYLNK